MIFIFLALSSLSRETFRNADSINLRTLFKSTFNLSQLYEYNIIANTRPRISTYHRNVLSYDSRWISVWLQQIQISDVYRQAHEFMAERFVFLRGSSRVVCSALTFTVYACISTHV